MHLDQTNHLRIFSRLGSLGLVIILSLASLNRPSPIFTIQLTEAGVYRVTYEDLRAAGFAGSAPIASTRLALSNQGQPVPIWIEDAPNGDTGDTRNTEHTGQFGPGDWFEFMGSHLPGETAYYNEFSAHNTYVLRLTGAHPARMHASLPELGTPGQTTAQVSVRQHLEHDRLLMRFQPEQKAMQELWYWAKLTHLDTPTFQTPLDLDPATIDPAHRVSIRLQFRGWSYRPRAAAVALADHRVEVSLNERLIGSGEWNGQQEYMLALSVPAEHIHSHHNVLTIRVPARLQHSQTARVAAGPADSLLNPPADPLIDVSLLNWIEIDFVRRPLLTAAQTHLSLSPLPQQVEQVEQIRQIRLAAAQQQRLVVYGATGSRIDVSRMLVQKTPAEPSDTSEYIFRVSAKETHLSAVLDSQFKTPLSIQLDQPSTLTEQTNQADYLMITHPRLREAIEPLAAFHRGRGLRVAVINIQDIYDEFHHSILHPQAIRDFIRYTHQHWTRPAPRFVLLVGDASWDTKNSIAQDANYPDWTYKPQHQTRFIKNGSTPYATHQGTSRNLIPTWNSTSYEGHAASDNWFVALDNTDFRPSLAIGRLPVTEPEDVAAIVAKTIRYIEQPEVGPWRRNILWITNEQRGFQRQSDQLSADTQAQGFEALKVYPDPQEADNTQHQSRLRQALNDGQLLVHFVGHGGRYIWRTGPPDFRKNHDLFTLDDLDQLEPTERLPIVVSMTCYSAPFDHPSADSIGEKFLRLPDRGAIAVFAASWRNNPSLAFSQAIMRGLTQPGTIGEAILQAKQGLANRLLVETYNLLGDPAVPIALPARTLHLDATRSPTPDHPQSTPAVQVTADIQGEPFHGQAIIDWLDEKGAVLASQELVVPDSHFAATYPGRPETHAQLHTVRVYVWDTATGVDGIGSQQL